MFTGIVEETGIISDLHRNAAGATLKVRAESILQGARTGDSIAVNGVCLTVAQACGDWFSCSLSDETLARTTFGRARAGKVVNLERSLEVGGRIGGHFVLGHVDGMGTIRATNPAGEGRVLVVDFPRQMDRFLVYKGSIALDGISLTIADLNQSTFTLAVIPHTLAVTNLNHLQCGDSVNLEADIIGKYVEKLMQPNTGQRMSSIWDERFLKEQGF